MDYTFFQVLTLRSNVLKVIGNVKYCKSTGKKGDRGGILCNWQFHWLMYDDYYDDKISKQVILSFDLSKEKFSEIPQPDNPRYEYTRYIRLWVTKDDCLGIFSPDTKHERWVLKNDNG